MVWFPPTGGRFAVLVQFLIAVRCNSYEATRGRPFRFLIMSSMRTAKISYCVLYPGNITSSSNTSFLAMSTQNTICGPVMPLIDAGTIFPQGLAVDLKSHRLYVADPGAKRIFSYSLKVNKAHQSLTAGDPRVAAQGAESRWVATDKTGAIYFTDEGRQLILHIPFDQLQRGNTTPQVLYSQVVTGHVSAPGGIATDTYRSYWVNKVSGTLVGTVIRGGKPSGNTSASTDSDTLYPMTTISDKSYGVCAASDQIFFTLQDHSVYTIRKEGGTANLITANLMSPRGCAFDGDGTVFVADRAGAVYALPATSETAASVTKAAEFEDAFGLSVYSWCSGAVSSAQGGFWLSTLFGLVSAFLFAGVSGADSQLPPS